MIRSIFLAAAALLGLYGSAAAAAEPGLRVGSKNFTESIVLAEMLRLEGQRDGWPIEHRRALGGSAILWQALRQGSIDAYPEYTGTLSHELLRELPPDAGPAELQRALERLGIGISGSLGFDDSYALAVSAQTAQRLSLQRLSELQAHPELRYGLSNEFLSRGDGWDGLRAAYRLQPRESRGLDHDLAYRALQQGAVDVIDVYTTDAEIPYYGLRVLEDDRRYFPAYSAVWLYRLDAAQRLPGLRPLLQRLEGRIDIEAMRRMNAQVKFGGRSETQAAAAFLALDAPPGGDDSLWRRLGRRTVEHLRLVGISLGLALALGLPLGVAAAHYSRLGLLVTAVTAMLQTLPSLAMLVFLIPLLGIGAAPAIAALFLYSLLPIVRNTLAGLQSIAPDLRESAAALGLPYRVQLLRVELPLAAPTIIAGISTAAVINIGTATLGALIGAGGYGEPILTGIRLNNIGLILEGAVPAAAMALLVQGLFQGLGRLLTPRGLRLRPAA